MRRKWHGRIFRKKKKFYKKFEKTWFFEAFFGFISETALRNSVKLGQKVVHIVPEHLQKTAQQNLFPFSRYSSSKMAFFGIFRSRKKIFTRKNFFFIFRIYILQFVKISKKNFNMKNFPQWGHPGLTLNMSRLMTQIYGARSRNCHRSRLILIALVNLQRWVMTVMMVI